MADIIIIAILLLCIGLALAYIIKAKKNGRKCNGCPGGCSGCSQNGSCQSQQ